MYQELLDRFVKMSRETLGENLVGVYLHGSLAMGCFNPAKSDLDLLLVVEETIADDTKIRFMEQVVELNKEAPAKGIEMSIVKRIVCKPLAYPTPYELHFSIAHLERFYQSAQGYVDRFHGTDKDLAAHAAIINRYGMVLYGAPVEEVFGEVPKEIYADSIWYDVGSAEEEITENPVYLTLNLCRALAYLEADLVLSKEAGGTWALETEAVPERYHSCIRDALNCYKTDKVMQQDSTVLVSFAAHMVDNIRKWRQICVQQ